MRLTVAADTRPPWQSKQKAHLASRVLRARAPRVEMVSSAPAGASNLLVGDLWGSPVLEQPHEVRAIRWRWLSTRWPVFCTLPKACTAPRSIGARACSTIAHIDRFYRKVRLHASWAPAESGSMSVNSAPPSACGSSAPAAARTQTGACHRDSASWAAPRISIGSCRRAISW